MPEELHGRTYYTPTNRGYEQYLLQRLDYLRKLDEAAPNEQRFTREHAKHMLSELKRRYPDLFGADHSKPGHD